MIRLQRVFYLKLYPQIVVELCTHFRFLNWGKLHKKFSSCMQQHILCLLLRPTCWCCLWEQLLFTKCANTLFEQNAEYFNVKAGGIYCCQFRHWPHLSHLCLWALEPQLVSSDLLPLWWKLSPRTDIQLAVPDPSLQRWCADLANYASHVSPPPGHQPFWTKHNINNGTSNSNKQYQNLCEWQ